MIGKICGFLWYIFFSTICKTFSSSDIAKSSPLGRSRSHTLNQLFSIVVTISSSQTLLNSYKSYIKITVNSLPQGCKRNLILLFMGTRSPFSKGVLVRASTADTCMATHHSNTHHPRTPTIPGHPPSKDSRPWVSRATHHSNSHHPRTAAHVSQGPHTTVTPTIPGLLLMCFRGHTPQ